MPYYNSKGEKIIRHNTKLNSFLDIQLAGITYPNPNYRIIHNISPQFLYDYYVFEYVVSGKGYIETKHDKITVRSGDLYFLNKLKQHTYYSDAEDPFKKIFIVLKGRFIDALVSAYQIHESVIVRQFDAYDLMMQLLDMMDTDQNLPYDELSMKILQLFQFLRDIIPGSESPSENFAEIIKNYLDSNLTNKLTLETICQDCHLSKSHVERIFTNTYAISPLQYFAQAKAQHAAALLLDTNYSLNEIAEYLSYSDVKYMSRCFKKYMGQSPLKYRKNKGKICFSQNVK